MHYSPYSDFKGSPKPIDEIYNRELAALAAWRQQHAPQLPRFVWMETGPQVRPVGCRSECVLAHCAGGGGKGEAVISVLPYSGGQDMWAEVEPHAGLSALRCAAS